MPIYEYECTQCRKHHEVMQRITDSAISECPDCKGELKKLISNTSFVLKGSGWYVTDYARNKNNGETQKTTASSSKNSDTGSDNGDKQADSPKTETGTPSDKKDVSKDTAVAP
jgi:putative FmdB family regulatory protein